MAQAQFESLLFALMDEDNDKRVLAEKMYMNTKKQQPNEVIQALVHVGRTSGNKDLRSLSIVLLRRALLHVDKEKALFPKLSPQTQALLKEQLLLGVQREEDAKVRYDFCEATSTLAADIFEDQGKWDGFLDFMLQLSQSSVDSHRHSALTILADLCFHLQEAFSGQNFSIIKQLVQSGLVSPVDDIRTASLTTCQNIILQFPAEYRAEMQTLLPTLLDSLAACLNEQNEDAASATLQCFITLTEHDPGFFKPAISIVLNAMLNICNANQLEDSTRQLALEFVISMSENKPNMCAQVPDFVKAVIHLLLQWMLEMPDLELAEWNKQAEGDDDEVDVESYVVAQEALDRFSIAIRSDIVAPIILEHIPTFLQHTDWKWRYVGSMSLSMIAEGLRTVLKPHLNSIVGMLLPLFSDPHPRVRWSAANATGQMSTDFGPRFQKVFHAEIIPRLIALFGDNENPKVQSHSCAALVNFCEKFPSHSLKPYLNNLLGALHTLLSQTQSKTVQEQAVTAIASVAGCSEKAFTEYYEKFLPLLKQILMTALGKDQTLLRGKAMECISLIGIAVGKEKFMPDVPAFMETLASIKTMDMEAEDPMRDFVLQTWMRVSSCLGPDFLPYLSYTMPQVLSSAALEAGFSISDSNVLSTPEDTEKGWDAVDIGDTRIKVHTVALEEKACACNMLLCFASEMKGAFFSYVEQVSHVICPLLTYNFHDGVRTACAALVPHLLNCVKCHMQANPNMPTNTINELFLFLFPPLVEAMRNDTELEVQLVSLESIHESLAVMGSGCLSIDIVKMMVRDVYVLIDMSRKRRAESIGYNHDDDENSTLIREDLMQEDSVMVELAEIVGALVKYHPDFFLEALKENFYGGDFLNLLGELIGKGRPTAERQFALCFFDDVVEHGKERSFPFWNLFMPFMLEYALDEHVGVRQAACYGLGVCAQQGGELFRPYVSKSLELLLTVVGKADSREDDNAPPTENAISSIGKILTYQASEINDVPALMKLWLSFLPLEVDDIEAKAVHKHFFSLIVSNHPHIFGQDGSNLPTILSIFIFLLKEETPAELVESKADALALLKQMYQQLPDVINKAAGVLTEDKQQILRALLSS